MSSGQELRAAIVGAGGTLGTALRAVLKAEGFELVAILSGRTDGDIRDLECLRRNLSAARPQVIFNCAAYTNVDAAESDREAAMAVNAIGAQNVATVAVEIGAQIVHYSTDFVFDGERETPYPEDAVPSPLSFYGKSKAEGEARVLAVDARALILRVGCLYGAGGRNFPSTLVYRLRAGESLRCDDERRVSPTWTVPVARVSAALARSQAFGIFHLTAHGETTWAGFARFLADRLDLGAAAKIVPLPAAALALPAPRPRRAILGKDRLAELGLDTLGDWQTQALGYLASLKQTSHAPA